MKIEFGNKEVSNLYKVKKFSYKIQTSVLELIILILSFNL